MRIFISGPYAKPDPVVNTRNAILVGDRLREMGHIPFIPHLNLQWHMVCPHIDRYWYAYDLEWLAVCDVVLRLPGESWGADREVEKAKKLGIKVIYDINEL